MFKHGTSRSDRREFLQRVGALGALAVLRPATARATLEVGRPGGPGEKPWGYGGREGCNPIYKGVLKTAEILDSQEIVQKKIVPFPFDDMIPPYPLWD